MDASLDIVTAGVVCDVIDKHTKELYEIVKNSYLLHEDKGCSDVKSCFLSFADRPEARIIALPAAVRAAQKNFKEIAGIKWIASYPNNKFRNLPRASAVIMLNHPETGFPMACMEGSFISATRTALSAIIGAEYLYNKDKICPSLGIVGSGFIAGTIVKYLTLLGWQIGTIHLYDKILSAMELFYQDLQALGNFKIINHHTVEPLIESSNLIVFTTTEKKPYINNPNLFKHKPCILHISLRDISPDIILSSVNIVDDIEHILAAKTSVHLAYEKNLNNNSFIKGTIGQIIKNGKSISRNNSIIYSPMGLGILDITVSQFVYNKVKEEDKTIKIKDFFFSKIR
jgi:ornithine cyclodeaminase